MAERRRRSTVVPIVAWLALLLAVYSAFAVVTIMGALAGLAGGFGALMSVWVLRQRPGMATRIVGVVALA
jgi:hypothetical protein